MAFDYFKFLVSTLAVYRPYERRYEEATTTKASQVPLVRKEAVDRSLSDAHRVPMLDQAADVSRLQARRDSDRPMIKTVRLIVPIKERG